MCLYRISKYVKRKLTLARVGICFFAVLLFFYSSCKSLSKNLSSQVLPPSTVTLAVVGDTNGYKILTLNDNPLEGIIGISIEPDIFLFNAEGVFSPRPLKDCHGFRQSTFFSSPRVLNFLKKGKVTIASLANNHVLDCGIEGIRNTTDEMKKRQIMTLGAGENSAEACSPVELEVNGLHIAVLAYLTMDGDLFYADTNKVGTASWEYCNGKKQIVELKEKNNIIIVVLHLHSASNDWNQKTDTKVISLVNNILDFGADVVIVSGPHIPQGVMQRGNGIALFSLGNFLFAPDYMMPQKSYSSILAKFILTTDNIKLTLIPLKINYLGKPYLPSTKESLMILTDIVELSNELGTTLKISEETGYIETKRN